MTMITWNCDTCLMPIDDYKGYVCISPYEATRRMLELREWTPAAGPTPEVLPWRTLHSACDPDPQGPEYWWDIERLRRPKGVEEFTNHLRWKNWTLSATDLESFAGAAVARFMATVPGAQSRLLRDSEALR